MFYERYVLFICQLSSRQPLKKKKKKKKKKKSFMK